MSGKLNLEILNGNWAIVSLSLMVICVAYLWHEGMSRGTFFRIDRRSRPEGTRVTQGMRVAVALLTVSFGVFIRSLETWRWRAGGGGNDISNLSQFWLMVGGALAVIGFLCAIREISQPLFGRGPWVWTLVVIVLFNAVTLIAKFS